MVKGLTASNQVRIKNTRPEQVSLLIDGHKREVLRIGWPEASGSIGWISILPAKIGFVDKKQEDTPAYIQRHAMNRLTERLALLDSPTESSRIVAYYAAEYPFDGSRLNVATATQYLFYPSPDLLQ